VEHRVAYEIQAEDGRILTQIGMWTGVRARPFCSLPAVQQVRGEPAASCCDRLVSSRLHSLAEALQVTAVERCVEKMAPFLGVDRRRVTRKVTAMLSCDLQELRCSYARIPDARLSHESVRHSPSAKSVFSRLGTESLDKFAEHQVVYICNGGADDLCEDSAGFFYAWLSPEDLGYLSGPGHGYLSAWVSMLSAPSSPCEPHEQMDTTRSLAEDGSLTEERSLAEEQERILFPIMTASLAQAPMEVL